MAESSLFFRTRDSPFGIHDLEIWFRSSTFRRFRIHACSFWHTIFHPNSGFCLRPTGMNLGAWRSKRSKQTRTPGWSWTPCWASISFRVGRFVTSDQGTSSPSSSFTTTSSLSTWKRRKRMNPELGFSRPSWRRTRTTITSWKHLDWNPTSRASSGVKWSAKSHRATSSFLTSVWSWSSTLPTQSTKNWKFKFVQTWYSLPLHSNLFNWYNNCSNSLNNYTTMSKFMSISSSVVPDKISSNSSFH